MGKHSGEAWTARRVGERSDTTTGAKTDVHAHVRRQRCCIAIRGFDGAARALI
jgi:hypothetical protein